MTLIHSAGSAHRIAIATRYWHAARLVLSYQARPRELMEPAGHLLNMVVELSLKAYLMAMGMTERQLGSKSLGHDLGALLKKCVEFGMKLSLSEANIIMNMRISHLSHFHRYGPNYDLGRGHAMLIFDEMSALNLSARLIELVGGDSSKLRVCVGESKVLDWPLAKGWFEPVSIDEILEIENKIEEQVRVLKVVSSCSHNS